MKILVTGSSGYIGSQILASFESMDGIMAEGLTCRLHDLKPGMIQPDLVIHSAGALRSRPADIYSVNRDGMASLLSSISRNIPVVYLSTQSVYGTKRRGFVSEEDTVTPDDDYGISKWQAEELLKSSGNPYLILRLTGVIGAGVRSLGYCFPCNALTAFHAGKAVDLVREDFVHQYICIDDVIKVIHQIIFHSTAWNNVYHVAGETRSLHTLIMQMKDACGRGEINYIDRCFPPRLVLSNNKTDALMGSDCWRTQDRVLIERAIRFLNSQSTR
jgi:nucleoside-diphosphate-sugar epimerase